MYLQTEDKWRDILRKVEEGIKKVFPIEAKTGRIDIISVEIPDKVKATISNQKDHILAGKSLGTPVYANLKLTRNNGKNETAKIKILDLPILTERGTFIVLGKDYSVFNQTRLKPGVYVRKPEGSNETFATFNLGKGLGFKIHMDSDGLFTIVFDKSALSTSAKKTPLYPLLKLLGAGDQALKAAWGEEIFNINVMNSHGDTDLETILEKVVYPTKRTGNTAQDLKDYFASNILNKDTTQVTLGIPTDKVDANTLIQASKKVMNVYANKEEEDDLDSLLFKEVLGVEDHLMLRIEKKFKETGLLYKLQNRIDSGADLKSIIIPNLFSKLVENFFTTSSLSAPQTEINPIEILETNHKITPMGEGGIQSDRGIPMGARNLHPSHLGFLDPVRTAESVRVGVDVRSTLGTTIKNRSIYSEFLDRKGNKVELRPMDTYNKVIGFPGQDKLPIVKVIINGETKQMPRDKVDYWLPASSDMFTVTTNLVPYLHNDQGNRVTMAGRMVTQAVPLIHREAPLVQIKDQSGEFETLHEKYGKKFFVPLAPHAGTITEVTDNYIKVDHTKVEMYHNFPLNQKTFITMYPLVKVGDKVRKGQVLADSNFTKNGELAIGTNVNVAYLPYKGWTHDDAVVISESASKKFTSQHMYMKEFEITPDTYIDKGSFIKWFPTKITPENIKKLDEQGVVKEGQTVIKGDVLVTGLRRKTLTSSDAMLKKLRGSLVNPYRDAAEVWDHDAPGLVTNVNKGTKTIRIVATTEDQAKRGDKLTGLHGNKCTIGLILPDNEMPRTKDGTVMDIMLNPASVPSRVNPGQLYEAMSGKRALALGHKVTVDNFDKSDSSVKVLNDLKKDGIKIEEELIDGKTGENLGKVFTGTPYFLKLHKQTEGNFSGLYRGSYDANKQPLKGGEEGSKGIGLLDVYALLGHNARANLAEMATYKSDKNDDFWNRLEAGVPQLPAKEPFAFKKFKSLITAAGMQVKEDENATSISPLTDKSIMQMSSGAIRKGAILENHMGKDIPEKGGIFDPAITGGMEGQYWSHIDLAAPIVNPIFEDVVKVLLHKDITGMNGKDVKKELAAINADKRIGEISAGLKVAKGSDRNKLLKELKYLTALKRSGMHPDEYVLTKFPIIPPQFRPIYDSQSGGLPMVSDYNYLYKDMLNVNEKLNEMKNFPDSEKGALLKDLRQSAHAVVGLMAPVNKQNQKRGVTGFMPQLVGSNYQVSGSSKNSFFQRKILKRQQQISGRGTILPDPGLDVDHVGIPEDMLWKTYEGFIIAELRKRGLSIMQAKEELQNKSETAKKILYDLTKDHPVIINRAPSLNS